MQTRGPDCTSTPQAQLGEHGPAPCGQPPLHWCAASSPPMGSLLWHTRARGFTAGAKQSTPPPPCAQRPRVAVVLRARAGGSARRSARVVKPRDRPARMAAQRNPPGSVARVTQAHRCVRGGFLRATRARARARYSSSPGRGQVSAQAPPPVGSLLSTSVHPPLHR